MIHPNAKLTAHIIHIVRNNIIAFLFISLIPLNLPMYDYDNPRYRRKWGFTLLIGCIVVAVVVVIEGVKWLLRQ